VDALLVLLINILNKGRFEKTEEGYIIVFGDTKEYIAELKADRVEFRIPTIKWVSGSYEPVEGSEIYKFVEYSKLSSLSDEDSVNIFRKIIEEL
jgi:UDP-N-acetylglucosamine transferase subunit ALG13